MVVMVTLHNSGGRREEEWERERRWSERRASEETEYSLEDQGLFQKEEKDEGKGLFQFVWV